MKIFDRTRLVPIATLAAFVLFVLVPGTATAQSAPPPGVSAHSLLAIATRALGTMRQAASADLRFTTDPGRVAPFWASLQGASQALAEVGGALGHPQPDLFSHAARATARIAELAAVWERIGLENADVQAGLATLRTSWTVFHGTYGAEGVRHRQDRPLSAEEARRLKVVRRAQERLAHQLTLLEAKARRAHEVEEVRRLAQFRARTEAAIGPANDLDAYLIALAAMPEIGGEWAAIKAAAPKARRTAYAAVDPIVEQIQTEAEAGSLVVLDLDQGKAWNFLKETTELPESLATFASALESDDDEEDEPEADEESKADDTADAAAGDESEIACVEGDEECLQAAAQKSVSPFPGTCGDDAADGCIAEEPEPELNPNATPVPPPSGTKGTQETART